MIRLEKNNPLPLYAQLKECLRREVATGAYSADEPLPDERALAQQLGLSRTTVRRAIIELTKEGLLGRIRGRGTFVKAATKVRPADQESVITFPPGATQTFTLAMVTPFLQVNVQEGLFYYRILQSMQMALGANSAVVFRKFGDSVEQTLSEMKRDKSLSAVAAMGLLDTDALKGLRKLNLPLVLIDCVQGYEDPIADEVTHHGEEPAFQAVTSLLDQGHRNIGLMMHVWEHVTGVAEPTKGWRLGQYAQQRRDGYERAYRTHKLAPDPELTYPVIANAMSAYAKMRAILKSGRVPTAMFCTTDEMALGVVQAVKDHGWRVPEHLSVIGFGDSGYFCTPMLSTVRIPMEQMGTAAVQLIREQIEKPLQKPRRIVVPTEWMPRATCDLPRS